MEEHLWTFFTRWFLICCFPFFCLSQGLHPITLVSSQGGKYPLNSQVTVADVEERVQPVSSHSISPSLKVLLV